MQVNNLHHLSSSNKRDDGSNNVMAGGCGGREEALHLLETGRKTKLAEGDSPAAAGNFKYEVAFDNIVSEEEEYTVTISTELNGRTVTQMVEKFPVGSPDDEGPAETGDGGARQGSEEEVKIRAHKDEASALSELLDFRFTAIIPVCCRDQNRKTGSRQRPGRRRWSSPRAAINLKSSRYCGIKLNLSQLQGS